MSAKSKNKFGRHIQQTATTPHIVKSRLNICETVRPDIRPLYLLFVELETDFVAIEINVVGYLERSANS